MTTVKKGIYLISDTSKDQNRIRLENDFYRTFKPFLIISQIFLCAPLGVHEPNKRKFKQYRPLLHRCHAFWCLGIYIALTIFVYDEYTKSNIDLPTVQKPLYFSEYIVYLIHLFEIILKIYIGRAQYCKFINFILDFDRKLLDFNRHTGDVYSVIRRFIYVHLFLILIHLWCTIIIGYFYAYGKLINFIRSSTVYILPNIIIEITLVQYYALLYAINERCNKLYKILQNLLTRYSVSVQKDSFLQELQHIRLLYAKLENFNRSVNDAFGVSILLVYFGSFVNISVNIFLLYKYTEAWSRSDAAWILYSVDWTIMHIGKMFLILFYNQNIQNRKKEANTLISCFNCGHNAAIESTMRHFILQFLSDTRSNVICGIIVLNMNFITSLLVAVSTLFIFLVQYDITFEALTNTHNSARPTSAV